MAHPKLPIRELTGGLLAVAVLSIAFVAQSQQGRNFGSVHLLLGTPSNATLDADSADDFLLLKRQYALSYNRSKSIPNWVSWQLNQSWLSEDKSRCKNASGQDDFQPDPSLPPEIKPVLPTDYRGSGFDRGHLAPSADRSANRPDNCATFLMTNIMPQSPDVNRGPWAMLESYCRDLAEEGKELYIIAGGVGTGGDGENGFTSNFDGRSSNLPITVPASSWKVIVVLDRPGLGVSGVTKNTRVIAVNMEHKQGVRGDPWDVKDGGKLRYITSVDEIERLTGYDFLASVPEDIQDEIEAKVDGGT